MAWYYMNAMVCNIRAHEGVILTQDINPMFYSPPGTVDKIVDQILSSVLVVK